MLRIMQLFARVLHQQLAVLARGVHRSVSSILEVRYA